MNDKHPLRSFLSPKSVALIGVSRRTGRGAFNILDNLIELGYAGKVYPVNPNIDTILGYRTYRSIDELPEEKIELAVLMLRRDMIPSAIEGCAKRGITSQIIISEGFSESDEIGKILQRKIDDLRKKYRIRIVGPNSLGTVNNFGSFSSTYISTPRDRVPVALITQSGGLLQGFSNFKAGKGIDLGNMCDIDHADAMDYFSEDPEIKVIVLHIEGVKNGRKFLSTARRVSRSKPVVAIKSARSEKGREFAFSHTGAMAGIDAIYDVMFKQAGIVRIDDVDTLGDVVNLILYQPIPHGNRIGIITPTGAYGIMLIDEMVEKELKLSQLSERTREILKPYFPPWSEPRNPLDIMYSAIAYGFKNIYQIALSALLEDPLVDAVFCICGYPTIKTISSIAKNYHKPVLTLIIGQWEEALLQRIKETGYFNVFSSPKRMVRAFYDFRKIFSHS